MDQRDLEPGRRLAKCCRCLVGVVVVNVVDADQADLIGATAERRGLVGQHGHAEALQRFDHVDGVVVAKNAENAVTRPDRRQHRLESRHDLLERPADSGPVIAGQQHGIDHQTVYRRDQALRQRGMRIEMEIGELQEGVSVERLGQVGERDFEPVEHDVERVALAETVKPGELQ